ncbi:hypothetical protein C5E10_18015 [Pseudoclavibacter sp. RFBG4]|nr:hypothetical protein C5E10_18015 [Pseudoclavibacter sp. RFBG4]
MFPVDIQWHHDVVSTLTGEPVMPMHPAAWDWRTVLNGAGDGSHTYRLGDPAYDLGPAGWDDALAKVRRTSVISYSINGGRKIAKYAGIHVGEDWDRASKTSVVQHREFRYLGDLRFFTMVASYMLEGHFDVSGYSKAGLLTKIWERGYRRPEYEGIPNRWNLPIRLPPALLGTDSARYAKWKFTSIEEATAAIQDTIDGPDIYVEPMWDEATGWFYWQAKFGNPTFPSLPFDVHLGADEHPLVNLKFRENGAKVGTGIFGIGNGSDESMRIGFGSYKPEWSIEDGMPNIDATEEFKNERDLVRLNQLAEATLAARRRPIRQYENSILAPVEVSASGGSPVYGVDIKPGWTVEIDDPGDERNAPSRADQYIIGVGHNSSSQHVMSIDYQQQD